MYCTFWMLISGSLLAIRSPAVPALLDAMSECLSSRPSTTGYTTRTCPPWFGGGGPMNKSTQSMDEYCRNLLRLGSLERLRHTAAASFAAATTNMDYWRLVVAGEEVSMQ